MERKVVVIVGPTCSGKTKLSLCLAKKLKSEIISADSRQFYKYLDIGTAKVSVNERNEIKHHFIDFLNPDQNYNVSKFEQEAVKVIESIQNRGYIPIVAGGSGLYINAILDGIFNTVNTDSEYRTELLELKKQFGNEYIYNKLKEVDIKSAESILPQNWKRIIRALEVYHLTGKPIWQLQNEYKRNSNLEFIQFGMNWDREVLYKNIGARVDQMLEQGLIEEVRDILNMGYESSLNSLNTVGYKEIISHLNGNFSKERAIELIKRNTRRFAKRQLTWFRKDVRINWINIRNDSDFEEITANIIKELG